MLYFDTQGRASSPPSTFDRLFKAIAPMPNSLRIGLLAALVWCCLPSGQAFAQCTNPSINCKADGLVNVYLGGGGTATIPYTDIVLSYDDMCTSCSGDPTFTVGPNTVDCDDVGSLSVNVIVTITNCGGFSTQCDTWVNVIDNVDPIMSAIPTSYSAGAETGTCAKVVTGGTLQAVIIDACLESVSYQVDMGPVVALPFLGPATYSLPTTTFTVGSHTVTWWVETTSGVFMPPLTTPITITDNEKPKFPNGCPANQSVNANASCAAVVTWSAPLVTDNCASTPGLSSSPVSGSTFQLGTTTVTYTATDGSNTETCSFTVTVTDNQAPAFGTPLAPLPLTTGGTITFSPSPDCIQSLVLNVGGVTDNCPNPYITYVVTKTSVMPNVTAFSGNGGVVDEDFEVGEYQVVFTAHDANGNTSTYAVTVIVEDTQDPVANCQDFAVSLDADGEVAVSAVDLDNGSDDNCDIASYFLSTDGGLNWYSSLDFDCDDIGTNAVLFSVEDEFGNTSGNCSATITIEDNTSPVAACESITVELDATGNATIDVNDIDNSSSDACGIFSMGIGAPIVLCATVAENDPFAWDVPVPMGAVFSRVLFASYGTPGGDCVNGFTIGACHAANSWAEVEAYLLGLNPSFTVGNGTFGDPCGGTPKFLYVMAEFVLPTLDFDCDDIGDNTVTLTVTDESGNVNTCDATVTIEDATAPDPQCSNLTVYLDEDGEVSVNDYATRVFNGTGGTISTSAAPGTGTLTRTITIAESAGILDLNLLLEIDHTRVGDLSATLTPPAATGLSPISLFDRPGYTGGVSLGCTEDDIDVRFDDGAFYTFTDFENTCENAVPTIEGDFQPIGLFSILNGYDIQGDWTLTITDNSGFNFGGRGFGSLVSWSLEIVEDETTNIFLLGDGTTDECDVTWSVSPNVLTCASLGTVNYTLTATDGYNNATCTGVITVIDEIVPDAICQTATVQLNGAGVGTLTPAMVDGGSDDNCNFTLAVDQTAFDCGDIGANTVTLTVTDAAGNSSACEATVIVEDNVPPSAACLNLSVALGNDGTVSVTASQVGIASDDNCTFSFFLDHGIAHDADDDNNPDAPYESFVVFECDDIVTGGNKVLVEVTDDEGNASVCSATITIQDNVDPVITCPGNITIECGDDETPANTGTATATDNCPDPVVTFVDGAIVSGTCSQEYSFVRTWTATDGANNTHVCTQTITVDDTEAPALTIPGDVELENCPVASSVADFNCDTWAQATDVAISNNSSTPGTYAVTSTIDVDAVGKLTSIAVRDLTISHTDVDDLRVTLTSPNGSTITLFDFQAETCGTQNVDADFEETMAAAPSCANINGQLVLNPAGNLLDFYGEEIEGDWVLTVYDNENPDGGALTNWALDICYITTNANQASGEATAVDACGGSDVDITYFDLMSWKDFDDNEDFTISSNFDFSIGTWTTSAQGNSSVNTAGAPDQIVITSSNQGVFAIRQTDFSHATPSSTGNGYVVFDWDYHTDDTGGPSFDPFLFFDGTTFLPVSDNSGAADQAGRAIIPLTGASFSFTMTSDDVQGAANVIISNFAFLDDAGLPATALDCANEFSIARVWNVEDACGNGALSQVQFIETTDDTAPSFDIVDDIEVSTDPDECTAYVSLVRTLTDACGDVAISHDGPFGSDGDASGAYEPGTYTITFTAEDECGNESTDVVNIIVTDDHFPTAICQPSVNINLGNASSVTLPAASVNLGSFDNCPGFDMQVTPNVFTLPGTYNVELVVTDASGNESSCPSVVNVVGANSITFDAGDASGNTGQTVTFPVAVSNFNNVGGFSFTLNVVNGTVAGITPAPGQGSVTGVSSSLTSAGLFSHSATSSTTLNVAWIAVPQTGVNIPNGNIFNVSVVLNGAAGQTTTVTVTDVDVINGAGNSLPGAGIDGTVTVLGTSNFVLSGTLLKEAGCGSTQLSNVTMNVTPTGISTPGSPFINQSAGSYNFTVPQGSSPTITPVKDINWGNGVDVGDVATVLDHFLGNTLMTSPYNVIAADANADDEIKIGDVFAIYAMITGTPVSGNTSWRFVDPSTFAPPAVTMMNRNTVPAFNESRTVANVQASASNLNFVGVKVGDVTCGASGSSMGGTPVADVRGGGQLPFRVDHVSARAGEEVVLTFKAQDFNDLLGYQFTLNFDKNDLQFQGFESLKPVELAFAAFSDARVSEGMLATTWFGFDALSMADGEALFVVKFKALNDINAIGDAVHASSDFIQAMAVNAAKDVLDVDLVFETANAVEDVTEGSRFALLQNRPNPFGHRTVVGFHLPEPTTATLTFTDAAGKVLKVVKGTYATGYHTATIERNDLPTTGVVFYRLDTDKHTAVRKMVLMD